MSERQAGLRKRTKPFTQTPNETVDDWTLSYRELGLLIRILRMPEGFVIRSEQLANEGQGKTRAGRKPGREGREAVRTALRKLALAGYYRLERCRHLDGTFLMRTSVTEEADELWAEQAAVFGGKAVPLYEQIDGSFLVKYPDGTMLSDGFPPPATADRTDPDTVDDEAEEDPRPETGFRAPGFRAPRNREPGKAEPGSCAPSSKTVREDGHKDSVPPSSEPRGDGSDGGQLTIDGRTERHQRHESSLADIANGLARVWVDYWGKTKGTPIAGGSPRAKMVNAVIKFLEAGYTEDEVRDALRAIGQPIIPTPDRMQRELAIVRGHQGPSPAGRQRGAGAQVNGYWDQRDAELVPAGSARPAAPTAEVQTEGAHW